MEGVAVPTLQDRLHRSVCSEQLGEGLDQVFLIEGPLDEIGVGADLDAPGLVALAAARAEEHDRQLGESLRGMGFVLEDDELQTTGDVAIAPRWLFTAPALPASTPSGNHPRGDTAPTTSVAAGYDRRFNSGARKQESLSS